MTLALRRVSSGWLFVHQRLATRQSSDTLAVSSAYAAPLSIEVAWPTCLHCGAIPFIAEAYSFNLTVIPRAGGSVGYVTLWPAGPPQPPVVATLTDGQGLVVSNAAIVAAGTHDAFRR
jgi:hypothetical protein